MSEAKIPKGTNEQYLSDLIIRGFIKACRIFPFSLRGKLMGQILRSLVAPFSGYKKRAIENLTYIYPTMDEAEKSRIANAVAVNAGRTFIENYDILTLKKKLHNSEIKGEGLNALQEARASGKPVLFVTGHFGNFEAPRAALVAKGYQIGGLYRPMSNPYFNTHYAENMHRLSGPVFEQGRRGTMGLLRHMKNGGMGVLLFDIYDARGIPITFMGKPAPTATSAAEIALKTGALLIPMFGVRRQDDLLFDIILQTPVAHGTALEMTMEMTKRLEAMVEEYPEQWFWIHRHWKPERHVSIADP